MELTTFALWLNSFFNGYDTAILSLMHTLAGKLGAVLTPLAKILTVLGENGIPLYILAVICVCFPRSRPFGVCVFGAVCCGALITNIILKDMVARPRPYEAAEQFRQWWQFVGAAAEEGFSFPSGHVTAAASGFMAISLMRGKKWVAPSVIIVLLMGFSRNYLIAHYPSDVLFAMIIRAASGVIAWYITLFIFNTLLCYEDAPFCDFCLNFDIRRISFVKRFTDAVERIMNNLGIDMGQKAAPARPSPVINEPAKPAPKRRQIREEAPENDLPEELFAEKTTFVKAPKIEEIPEEEPFEEPLIEREKPGVKSAPSKRRTASSRAGGYKSFSGGYKGRHEK